jgi:hypothetical protein
MEATSNIRQTQSPKCWVLVVTGQGDLRSGITALLQSLPQIGHIYFADTPHEVDSVIESKPIRLAILDEDYLGDRMSEVWNTLKSKTINVITLSDSEVKTGANSGSHIMKGVRPEKLLMEIERNC